MSAVNAAVLFVTGGNLQGQAVIEVVPGPAAAQATATRVTNQLSHVTKSVSTGSLILPSILNGEANEQMTIVNDAPVAVNVYPAVGEKMQTVANAAFSVSANCSAVFYPELNCTNLYPSGLNWHGALIT